MNEKLVDGRKDLEKQSSKEFTDLNVWKRAHEFVLAVYEITKEFPASEQYGLSS